MDRLEQFLNFAEQAPTAFHAASGFRDMLREAGFSGLPQNAYTQETLARAILAALGRGDM